MKRRRYLLGAIMLTAVLAFVTIRLFDQDFADGQTYPEYSSLRADPKGSKLLYDSLSRVPGLKVSRNFQPVNTIAPHAKTLVFLSCGIADPGLDVLESLALSGNRVVISLPNEFETAAPERWMLRHWGLRFTPVKKGPDLAKAGIKSPVDLTVTTWTLSAAIGWTVIDQDGPTLLAVEKPFGKGSIVLFANSMAFNNMVTLAGNASDLRPIATALGANSAIIFDESHLGVTESGSVVALAQRFRLTGLAIGFAILAALFLWRNTNSFPPARDRLAAGPARSASQGLEALLRRHVPVPNLAANCWREWIVSNRREFPEEKIKRAEAVASELSARPLEAARRIHEVLYSKGEL
jgi:hypothetical protein